MNNKPVAWMYACNGVWTAFSDELPPDDAYDEGTLTPLYTHPHSDKSVKAKTLTDEEILKLYVNNSTYDNDQKLFIDIYGFAKAILRKAQEK